MMKPGIPTFVVDSVERAIKFYTEKLGFDVDNLELDQDARHSLSFAELSKGKFHLQFRIPAVEELAEFSLIKRCGTRGAGAYVHIKKGLDKYFERCKRKGIIIINAPKERPWGERTFTIRDPFGIRLTFAEPITGFKKQKNTNFLGMSVSEASAQNVEEMVKWLRGFGILRRASKKYIKSWLEDTFSKRINITNLKRS